MTRPLRRRMLAGTGSAVLALAVATPLLAAQAATTSVDLSWLNHPRTTTRPGRLVAGPTVAAGSAASSRAASPSGSAARSATGVVAAPPAIPTFVHAYAYGGKTYGYWMVGSDPLGKAATTTIANNVVPVGFNINGQGIAPNSGTLAGVTNSGLFKPMAFPGGTGQYGDIFMRTQFQSWLAGPKSTVKNWHVVLAKPVVKPQLTLDVPAGKGELRMINGVRVALVDLPWLDDALAGYALTTRADVLTQFVGVNMVLCEPYSAALTHCGIGGYHSYIGDSAGDHTFSMQSYIHSAVFGVKSGFSDIGPMSHELAEWLANPLLRNLAPGWKSPLAPQYGCSGGVEVGDPVVGRQITVNKQHYADEAYLWWFSRSPSRGWLHRYTWFNSFTTLPKVCALGA